MGYAICSLAWIRGQQLKLKSLNLHQRRSRNSVEEYNVPSFGGNKPSAGSSVAVEASKYLRSIICGVIAAAVGAVIWAFISKTTGYEIGYIAIGVGFLAGLGVQFGGAEQSVKLGVTAAVIAICGIMGGKLLTVNWLFEEFANGSKDSVSNMTDNEILEGIAADDSLIDIAVMSLMTDDMKLHYLAIETTEQEMEEQREKLLPEAETLAKSWSQDEIIANARAAYSFIFTEGIKANKGQALKQGFIESFGLMDLLFIFLAVSASYRMCSSSLLSSN